jgi:peptidoglycan-associated lipoprotein
MGKVTAAGPLSDIYFAYEQYDLNETSRAALKAHAKWLKDRPAVWVEIEGHCDARGTAEYNLALGAKRAQAAKDYLTALGIPAARITVISYGAELPVCNESTEECWQKNRRDRFVVRDASSSARFY